MEKLMMIFGAVIGVEVLAVYILAKLFKDLPDEEVDRVVQAMYDIQYKRYW